MLQQRKTLKQRQIYKKLKNLTKTQTPEILTEILNDPDIDIIGNERKNQLLQLLKYLIDKEI